ncbi:MAG: helix-turn-helix domain-containing protein [Actinomycetota bacterium]
MFELGNSLREARVRQGLEFPQVELATKIRAKYIRALEDEAFEILPSETYVKGFLRSYAEYLGLDGQLYVDEFNSRNGERFHDEPPRRARVHQDRGLERKVVLAALAGIAALTALVIVAWKFGGGDSSNGSLPPTTTTTPPAPTALVLRGVGAGTYVTVHRNSASGTLLLAGTIRRGEVQRIAGNRFWLSIEHSSAVRVSLGGHAVSLPARKNLRVLVTPTRTALTGG